MTQMVCKVVEKIVPTFSEKLLHAENQAIEHFLHRVSSCYHAATHVAQKYCQEAHGLLEAKSCKHESRPCNQHGPNFQSILVPQPLPMAKRDCEPFM